MTKKCRLCGRKFNNKNYQLFGTSCFKTICDLLDIVIPKNVKEKDKEKYLCSLRLDRFDFTDFIFPEEYNDKYKEIDKDYNIIETNRDILDNKKINWYKTAIYNSNKKILYYYCKHYEK